MIRLLCLLSCVSVVHSIALQNGTRAAEGAKEISFFGYDDCILLSNEHARAILCPAAGGRILEYSIHDKNILYLSDEGVGWTWDGSADRGAMNAGRFDIGPEQIVKQRPVLWQGKWSGQIIGDRKAVLRSEPDANTGVRLERTFELDATTSRLRCTQKIVNVSDAVVEYCHWSRTFVSGKGTCIIPLSSPSRFPSSYVRYDPPGRMLNMSPEDVHIQKVDDFLLIDDRPLNPKLGFDSYRGWLAYLSKQHLLFIKRFPTYPDRVYNEVAALTISVWYPEGEMVELEPIGPRERLAKGEAASFTETWFLVEHDYQTAVEVNPSQIAEIAERLE